MMIAAGDPIKARQIYYGSTVVEAVAAAVHLKFLRRVAEFNRQRLFQIINNSLGGSYAPDASLLEKGPKKSAKPSKKQLMKNWLKLAGRTGDEIPEVVRRIIDGE